MVSQLNSMINIVSIRATLDKKQETTLSQIFHCSVSYIVLPKLLYYSYDTLSSDPRSLA